MNYQYQNATRIVLCLISKRYKKRPRSPAWPLFPCPGSRRISWLLCSSGFRFQYPRHFVGSGGRGVFLEIAGHDKDGIAHADFRHAVGAAGGAGVGLLVICHRQYSFQSVISFFMLSIFRCAASCRKLSPVKRTGTHMESRRS